LLNYSHKDYLVEKIKVGKIGCGWEKTNVFIENF